jgi:hypothetical protein
MSKQEELREALSILKNLLRTVNAVCGVVRFANGTSGLAVDPEYIDLGEVVEQTARFFELLGEPSVLRYSTETDDDQPGEGLVFLSQTLGTIDRH